MIYTTLNAIRAHHPCQDGWEKLLKHLGKTKADAEPLAMTAILDSNGIDDANWCLRALGPEHHKLIVGLACDYAEMALKYVPAGETRPAECIRITRLWIEGKATLGQVEAAADAARAAASAASAAERAAADAAAWAAADAAAWAAERAAADAAAWAAAWAADAAERAAWAAAWDAAWAARAAAGAAWAAAWDAAWAARAAAGADMREKQAKRFREVMEDSE